MIVLITRFINKIFWCNMGKWGHILSKHIFFFLLKSFSVFYIYERTVRLFENFYQELLEFTYIYVYQLSSSRCVGVWAMCPQTKQLSVFNVNNFQIPEKNIICYFFFYWEQVPE